MPNRHRNKKQATARLHQMACLDFNGPQLIEPVFQQLRQLIGFDSCAYVYPGGEGELEVFTDSPALRQVVPDYFDPRIMRSELRVLHRSTRCFADSVRYELGPMLERQFVKVDWSEFLRSDFYNVVLRPADVYACLSLMLRTPQGRGVGAIKLYRGAGSPTFSPEDAAVLGRLEPCLARALQPGELDAEGSMVAGSGLLIATPLGRLLWISPEAEKLMPLAFGWRWRGTRGELPQVVQLLLHRLQWACQAQEGTPGTALPQIGWRNAGGWFTLRATKLTPAAGEAQATAIHLTQRIPRTGWLLQALEPLALPPRQHELAYWIARGCSESQIADRMGISVPTVVYHRRSLYERLDVQDRQGLLARVASPCGG